MNFFQRRDQQLGMIYTTARARLNKMLLFDLVKRAGRDSCYRCGELITRIEEFSIDHKEPWFDSSPDLFWDLDNIEFSHLYCNSRANRFANQ